MNTEIRARLGQDDILDSLEGSLFTREDAIILSMIGIALLVCFVFLGIDLWAALTLASSA